MGLARKLWTRGLDALPVTGYHFDRPIVVLQSDDWGRVGLSDQAGLEQLRSAGLELGERPYDFYTLETADDVSALADLLGRHRDSIGRNPCLLMNFIVANVDFAKASTETGISLRQLADGLPDGWNRPGLIESYREGIAQGVFSAALHGTTHFCRASVERALANDNERSSLLHNLWKAGTPYIHWRMPWIGYEYWDPEAKPLEHSQSCSPLCRDQRALQGIALTTTPTVHGRNTVFGSHRMVPENSCRHTSDRMNCFTCLGPLDLNLQPIRSFP
jgi:hypothetical protein